MIALSISGVVSRELMIAVAGGDAMVGLVGFLGDRYSHKAGS
jgi:hypothetical protein